VEEEKDISQENPPEMKQTGQPLTKLVVFTNSFLEGRKIGTEPIEGYIVEEAHAT
jgi:hypothetical protein